MNEIYDSAFYAEIKATGRTSAQTVVPLVMEWIAPSSVVDIGCGTGAWLNIFREAGVQEIHGVEGDYVQRDSLDIPGNCFEAYDLGNPYTSDRKFDLAMSLEVGEHLPEQCASQFVESLVNLAPVVLFSAAIPGQGGKQHINCQWPAYWADLFNAHDYLAVDCLRTIIWDNPGVDWWYQQNIMIYVQNEKLDCFPKLKALRDQSPQKPLSLVHPACLHEALEWGKSQFKLYWDLTQKAGIS